MLGDIAKAKIIITNYHAFKRRETLDLSKVGRSLLQGHGEAPVTIESEGQMLQCACGELMVLNNVVVINDEAHHCYREKPQTDEAEELKGEENDEAKKNNEAARLWISGIDRHPRRLRPIGDPVSIETETTQRIDSPSRPALPTVFITSRRSSWSEILSTLAPTPSRWIISRLNCSISGLAISRNCASRASPDSICSLSMNLVELMPDEHRIAHLLLAKIYPHNSDLRYAAFLMTMVERYRGRSKNRQYAWVRCAAIEAKAGSTC